MTDTSTLPRWDVDALFPSLGSREFAAAHEGLGAEVAACSPSTTTHDVGEAAPHAPDAGEMAAFEEVIAPPTPSTTPWTDRGLHVRLRQHRQPTTPTAGPALAAGAPRGRAPPAVGPLHRLGGHPRRRGARRGEPGGADHAFPLAGAAERAEHQMGPDEESLYARAGQSPARGVGPPPQRHHVAAAADVHPPTARSRRCRSTAVRGLATHADPAVRRAALRRRAGGVADGGRAVRRGHERHQGRGQHRQRPPRLGRPARRVAVRQRRRAGRRSTPWRPPSSASLPDFRRWLRAKARAARPRRRPAVVGPVRPAAGARRRGRLGRRAGDRARAPSARTRRPLGGAGRPGRRRALDRRRARATASAAARSACRSSATARSSCSTGRAASTARRRSPTSWATPTTTPQLADRTPLQRQLPMALAETASIFCETLVVEAGLARPHGRRAPGPARRRPAGRDPGRRRHPQPLPVRDRGLRPPAPQRTLGVAELNELMVDAQARRVRRRARPRHAPPVDVGA